MKRYTGFLGYAVIWITAQLVLVGTTGLPMDLVGGIMLVGLLVSGLGWRFNSIAAGEIASPGWIEALKGFFPFVPPPRTRAEQLIWHMTLARTAMDHDEYMTCLSVGYNHAKDYHEANNNKAGKMADKSGPE